jgi:uncharacterized protein with HEPN domain
MSRHDDSVRLRHMLDAAEKAIGFVKGKVRADLDRDEKLTLAVTRLVEIIGEAAAQMTDAFQKKHKDIPWKEIIATRNRLIHGYFDIDLNILWNIVTSDLPQVAEKIKALLKK